MAKKSKKKKTKNYKELKNEFKQAISTAIIAAFGIVMALAWKDVIEGFVQKITSVSPIQGKLITALFITLVGVLGIWLVTKLFKENEK